MGCCNGEIASNLKDDNKEDATSEGDTDQSGTALAVDVGWLVVSVTLNVPLHQQGQNPRQGLHLNTFGEKNHT